MEKNVFRKMRYFMCLTLAAICLVGMPCIRVDAAKESQSIVSDVEAMETRIEKLPEGYFDYLKKVRAVLTECRIIIDFESSGMGISIFTGTTDECPEVGVKDIKIEQKVWYGWKLVAYADGASFKDTDGMAVGVTYTGAEKGKTYRVSCVHYADLTYDGVTKYTEGTSNTGAFVFTY